MTLQFEQRSVYGKQLFYPLNEAARAVVDITGRKCLKSVEIDRLRYGGHDVRIQTETKEILK